MAAVDDLTLEMMVDSGKGGWSRIGVIVLVMGVFLPLMNRQSWIESPVVSLYQWSWVPLFLTAGVVADSFAGSCDRSCSFRTRLPPVRPRCV